MSKAMIVSEGGMNWCWFTELEVSEDGKSVKIIRYWRMHNENMDKWPESINHPEHWHQSIWKEDKDRNALEYNVPGTGWLPISNPDHIFKYD